MSLFQFEARGHFGEGARLFELDGEETLEDLHDRIASAFELSAAQWGIALSGFLYDPDTMFGTYGRPPRSPRIALRELGLVPEMRLLHLDQPSLAERRDGPNIREQFHTIDVTEARRDLEVREDDSATCDVAGLAASFRDFFDVDDRRHTPMTLDAARELAGLLAGCASPSTFKAIAERCFVPAFDACETLAATALRTVDAAIDACELELAERLAEELTRLCPPRGWVCAEAWHEVAFANAIAGRREHAWRAAKRADEGLHGDLVLAAKIHAALGEPAAVAKIAELQALPWSGSRWQQRGISEVAPLLRRAGLVSEAVALAWQAPRKNPEISCVCGSRQMTARCCFRDVRA